MCLNILVRFISKCLYNPYLTDGTVPTNRNIVLVWRYRIEKLSRLKVMEGGCVWNRYCSKILPGAFHDIEN